MKIYKISQNISGEWWIIDGEAIYADGDIGDMNHETYAIEQARRLLLDSYSDFIDDEEFESWKTEKAIAIWNSLNEEDREKLYKEYNYLKKSIEEDPEEFLLNFGLRYDNIDEDLYLVANGNHHDIRLYAMKQWGWIAVRGNYVNTWQLTSQQLKKMVDGLYEILEQSMGEVNEETEFIIEIYSSKKTYWNIPFSTLDSNNISSLLEYERKFADSDNFLKISMLNNAFEYDGSFHGLNAWREDIPAVKMNDGTIYIGASHLDIMNRFSLYRKRNHPNIKAIGYLGLDGVFTQAAKYPSVQQYFRRNGLEIIENL